jgi:hypothetical protein
MIVIGIPNWKWKPKLLKWAIDHPNLIERSVEGLCHECSRHLELLKMFDNNDTSYKHTEYYRYQKNKPKVASRYKEDILAKIKRFKGLYEEMKQGQMVSPPVITDDGCRLDGSHRCAIMQHMGGETVLINTVRYEDIYDAETATEIRRSNKVYRQSIYGITE